MKKLIQLTFFMSLVLACQESKNKQAPEDSKESVVRNDRDAEATPAPTPTTQTPAPASTGTTLPSGCTGAPTIAANDLVLFQGEALAAPVNNVISLGQGWRIDEVWDNGRLQVEPTGTGTSISFSNEGIYHGFKFTPPSVNGVRKNFTVTGAEVYVELQRPNPNAALPTFGLRVIKPNEFEGNGGAATTTWMLDKPVNGTRFFTAPTACTLIPMSIPQAFLDQKAVGNRLIWEMQSNWSPADKIVIRQIVLKGFQFIP